MRNPFTIIIVSWFIIVNLPQVIPFLNRIDPLLFGVPFNIMWIWGWNLLISIYLVYCALKVWKTPSINIDKAREEARKNGLEVE